MSKDCAFETVVVGAEFDTNDGKWTVKTQDVRYHDLLALYLVLTG